MSEPKPASITATATGSGRYILLRDGWVDKWVWVHTDEELAARDAAVRREMLAQAKSASFDALHATSMARLRVVDVTELDRLAEALP